MYGFPGDEKQVGEIVYLLIYYTVSLHACVYTLKNAT